MHDLQSPVRLKEQRYAELYRQKLELTQKFSKLRFPVHLLFGPLGSNINFLANQVRLNVQAGVKTCIRLGNYDFDDRYLAQFNQAHGTQITGFPWVLQRYGDNWDHLAPWTIWFQDINHNNSETQDLNRELQQLDAELVALTSDASEVSEPSEIPDLDLLELGLCQRYVTRLQPQWQEKLDVDCRIPEGQLTLAMHIRRGDACSPDLDRKDPNRKHFSVERYLEKLEVFAERGYHHLYVLSESQSVIDRIGESADSQWTILNAELDRHRFVDAGDHGKGTFAFVEHQCLRSPEFTEFLNSSALVDLHNAGFCSGLIGTLSSQYSLTSLLAMIGRQGSLLPWADLSNAPYSDILLQAQDYNPSRIKQIQRQAVIGRVKSRLERTQPYRLASWPGRHISYLREQNQKQRMYEDLAKPGSQMVIKERDVGFFSLFLQVVNTLMAVKEANLQCRIWVDFGHKQAYYQGSNTWLQCFEPDGLEAPEDAKLFKVRQAFETEVEEGDISNWDVQGAVFQVTPELFWTGSYYPILTHGEHQGHISHEAVPTLEQREKAADIIARMIRPRAALEQSLAPFVEKHLSGKYVIAAQYRGTDAKQDSRRNLPGYREIWAAIESTLDSLGPIQRENAALLLASDEQRFINETHERFPHAVCFDGFRARDDEHAERKDGPAGKSLPGFVLDDSAAALHSVIYDYLLLCKADVLIHPITSVSHAALLTNPAIKSIQVGADYLRAH